MILTKAIKAMLFATVSVMLFTGFMAALSPAEAGPIIRNRVKGAVAGAAVGAIVGDPASGARIGRSIGTVKGIKERRDNRRDRIERRR